jgi:pyruvate ferredoxin oxidoreductase delta subunit
MGYCPVNSIYFDNGAFLISYDFCKGCGICSVECPKKAIDMVPEGGK